jgi:hypothetical protein
VFGFSGTLTANAATVGGTFTVAIDDLDVSFVAAS